MTKKIRVLVLVITVVCILSGTASAFEGKTVGVYLQENLGEKQLISTRSGNVEDLLKNQGIILNEYDSVNPSLDAIVEEDMEIQILRGVDVTVVVDGNDSKSKNITTKQMPLNQFVSQYSAQTGTSYIYDVELFDSMLTDGMTIYLLSQKTETFTETSEIPFETEYIDTIDMYEGEFAVLTEGINGTFTTVTRVDYISGEEDFREVLSEGITNEPTTAVILRGTAKLLEVPSDEVFADIEATVIQSLKHEAQKEEEARIEAARLEAERIAAEKAEAERQERLRIEAERKAAEKRAAEAVLARAGINNLEYVSMLTMSATAYTADYASTGKRPGDPGFGITRSGMKAQVGVVAVDPRVIPLGTHLYIEGYGKAIAGDTGGAIKGNRIDLYFNSSAECFAYGRRNVKVYILK